MSHHIGEPGVSGGSIPTLSLAEAQQLYEKWRGDEYGWVRARLLVIALRKGEYHADDMIGVQLSSPNAVGAAINALSNAGLFERLNARGQQEYRPTKNKTSRRSSFVWRLTPNGAVVAREIERSQGAALPDAPRPAPEEPEALFDVPAVAAPRSALFDTD